MTIPTILSPFPPHASTCGYCGPPGGRSAKPTNKHEAECIPSQLSCEVYQKMIDRGWRRSGTYCYKPDLKRSCCPQYTIKLDALQFKPSKSHRKLVNRFNRWVLHGDDDEDHSKSKGRNNAEFVLADALHASESSYHAEEKGFNPAHVFEVTLEPSSYTEEKFALYQEYQKEIHKEKKEKEPDGFNGFLVESPLHRENIPYTAVPPAHLPRQYGAYHQLYRMDGELIAMGVIDVLPNCVSSVYLMWKKDWERFSLGKLSALREATLAREIHEAGVPGMGYLYMGFYIQSCPKMRYKGEYSPSFLVDPETQIWYPLEKWRPLLDKSRYVSISHPENSIEGPYSGPMHEPHVSSDDLQEIKVLVGVKRGSAIVTPAPTAKEWKNQANQRALRTTAHGLGMELAKQVIFKLGYVY